MGGEARGMGGEARAAYVPIAVGSCIKHRAHASKLTRGGDLGVSRFDEQH